MMGRFFRALHTGVGPGVVSTAPRGPKTPPPGVRPGSLAEPGPQRSDRSLRRSSGQTPLLGVPSLADAPAEAIDGRTLRYLLKANIARKKFEEEEEEEKKYQERAAESRRREQALLDHAASLPKRKRKKKRKKKLPRGGCRRPYDLQRQVPAALRVLRVPRQNGGHSCNATETGTHSVLLGPGAVLGQGCCAHVAQRQGYGQTVQKTVLVPQLQFIEGRHPFVPQREFLMVLPVQKAIETPQLQSVKWSMPLLCRSCHARCRADRCSWFRLCRKLWRCRSCSSSIRHLCRGAETDSHGPVQDHRNSSCHCSCRDLVLFVGKLP